VETTTGTTKDGSGEAAEETVGIIDANLNGHGRAVYEAAKNAGFEIGLNEEGGLDLADACALVDHESGGGQNIFGCGWGAQWTLEPPYCNVPVTADRVQALLENIDTGGGQNGVGLTQLTSVNLVLEAEQRGGAHLPKHQCSVGFEYLKSLVDDLGYVHGIAAYNSGPSNAQLGITNGYYGKVQARREKWKGLLAGVLGGVVTGPATKPEVEPATQPGISMKRSGILKAKEGTNFRKGFDYILPIIGQRDYWVWSGGPVPDGEGMYADNKPLPPVEQIGNINCAGTTNLFFRAMRKRIPTLGNPLYDGGVAAYAGGAFGNGYFFGYSEPFDLGKAKSWAQETLCGVLLLRPYWDASLAGQGHVAILLPSGYVLQSFPNMNGPDLNWDFTIEQSNAGNYYKEMVHPSNWSEYSDPEDDW
jgi:hypothetical protein